MLSWISRTKKMVVVVGGRFDLGVTLRLEEDIPHTRGMRRYYQGLVGSSRGPRAVEMDGSGRW